MGCFGSGNCSTCSRPESCGTQGISGFQINPEIPVAFYVKLAESRMLQGVDASTLLKRGVPDEVVVAAEWHLAETGH